MKRITICLDNIKKVQGFQLAIKNLHCLLELESGSCSVNARSQLGVFTLNLSEPLELVLDDDSSFQEVYHAVKPYIISR